MKTVLHVDGSAFYTSILRRAFESQGYRYLSALTIGKALDILEGEQVDLIVAGYEFSDGSGEDLLKRVGADRHATIPILIISGSDSLEMRQKMLSLGAIDFISKNISYERLCDYIIQMKNEEVLQEQLLQASLAVLDDSETQIHMIRKILETQGITDVGYYKTGGDLLASDREYGIYLIDIILPDCSGEEIILNIRKKHPRSVIIAISAIDHYKAMSNVLVSGADDYIIKPFNEILFMARIKANMRAYTLVGEIEAMNAELRQMTLIDGLTRLYNHKYIHERLEDEIEAARRYGRHIAIIMLDLDHFKDVNDRFGHQTGDRVLVSAAETINEVIREVDLVGRYGGEEFMVILPETDAEGAAVTAERIRKAIAEMKFSEKDLKVTVSAGVAELFHEDALHLVQKADRLLYTAKEKGRNRVEY